MFETVLVGVDGRSTGRDAIALAHSLAPDASLTLVNVRADRDPDDSVEMLGRELQHSGLDAKLVSVVSESAGRGLHQQAESLHADLLVVGSCTRGMLGRAALGDDTRAALNGAPCAIAVASRGYAERDRGIANIGVAFDGSPESQDALQTARQLAAAEGAAIHVLEVVSMPSMAYAGFIAPGLGETVDQMLEDARSRLAKLSGVDTRAVYGIAGEELAAFGDEVDILVVGSRGYGPVRRLVAGSTTDYLERHARCPLLVLTRAAGYQRAYAPASAARIAAT